jgi:3-methyladenine DNA glycosylase AlkD
MTHAALISELANELLGAASNDAAQALQRFFTSPVSALGVSNALVTDIAAAAVAGAPAVTADDWLAVADHFARSHQYHEHFILASALVAKVVRRIDDADRLFDHLQGWLEADVSNWAQCDDLCIKPLYLHIKRHHHLLDRVYGLGSSSSPWCRRASNVALVKFVGRSKYFDLDQTLANCERLLADEDPYVQKGIGWMLKVASQHELRAVLAFLQKHRTVMVRSTLRYAIEKFPADMRRELMGN